MSETQRIIDEIAAERRRQIEVEGWTPGHDDGHMLGELAGAAACYASNAASAQEAASYFETRPPVKEPPPGWPWLDEFWKPKDRRHDLIRAAALIVAEIERLDRAKASDHD